MFSSTNLRVSALQKLPNDVLAQKVSFLNLIIGSAVEGLFLESDIVDDQGSLLHLAFIAVDPDGD